MFMMRRIRFITPSEYIPLYLAAMTIMLYGTLFRHGIKTDFYALPILAWGFCSRWMHDVTLRRKR